MSNLIKGNLEDGWDLSQRLANNLARKGIIENATQNALKQYFVDNVLVPELKKLYENKITIGSKNEISGLRRHMNELPVRWEGKPAKLHRFNVNFDKILKGKKVNQSDILNFSDPARDAAKGGHSPGSKRQADFWNEVELLKNERNESILNDSHPDNAKKQNNIFENKMKSLIHKNRRWISKDLKFDPMQPDKIGWSKGSNEEGYFKWQNQTFADSQAQTRAMAQKAGVKIDAGHVVPLGGLKLSPEEFNNLDANLKGLIRLEGEKDPDVKGGYIIRGTNAASNLGIEIAKYNRSKGSLSARHIEDVIELNTSWHKLGSIIEYNNRNDVGYRKNTDYSEAVRSLLSHSSGDINAIQAMGEQEILERGIREPEVSTKPQTNITGELSEYPGAGPVTTTKFSKYGSGTGGIISQRTEPSRYEKDMAAFEAGQESDKETLAKLNRPNQLLDLGSKAAITGLGLTPGSSDVVNAVKSINMINKAIEGDLTDVAVGVAGNVLKDTLTTTTPYYGLPGS